MKIKYKVFPLLAALILVVTSTSCAASGKQAGSSSSAPSAASAVTKDRAGNAIRLPSKIDRIIPAAPSDAEILVALGLADKIVAVDKDAADVAGIKKGLPQIDFMNPDAEKIMALKPDLVLVSSLSNVNGQDPFKPLKDAGICVASIPSSTSLQGIIDDISFIAGATGTPAKGKQIVAGMKAGISKIKSAVNKSGGQGNGRRKVYFEIGPDPTLYSFGSGVFLNEMITDAGGKNIFADKSQWISVTPEAVVAANPDIIFTNVNYSPDPVGEIKARKGWENISAVKNNRVYQIDADASSRPSQNVVKALEQMAKDIHPDLFK